MGCKENSMAVNPFFGEVKKNFGFGCMRLPMTEDGVDLEQFSRMVDRFLESGFNYFDTAHGYISGRSETAIRECLSKRHNRDEFILVNKLSSNHFEKEEDIRPLFQSQLEACGVDYFDFYLMHSQNAKYFEKYKAARAYETAFDLKKEGKVRHVGLSFHDKADVLDKILTEYPQIEVVQIQFNYLDYNDAQVEGRKCYEVCVKHNKPVIVMEPVKGGSLVNLPEDAKKYFDDLNGGSYASYAIRFAASFDNVMMVLSGMSNMEQMEDNISYMADFEPINDKERAAIDNVCAVFSGENTIKCTACEYCVDGCPVKIPIPNLFADYNSKIRYNDWSSGMYYNAHTKNRGKASDCIKCGKCEKICPQHLNIRELLVTVAEAFEK